MDEAKPDWRAQFHGDDPSTLVCTSYITPIGVFTLAMGWEAFPTLEQEL